MERLRLSVACVAVGDDVLQKRVRSGVHWWEGLRSTQNGDIATTVVRETELPVVEEVPVTCQGLERRHGRVVGGKVGGVRGVGEMGGVRGGGEMGGGNDDIGRGRGLWDVDQGHLDHVWRRGRRSHIVAGVHAQRDIGRVGRGGGHEGMLRHLCHGDHGDLLGRLHGQRTLQGDGGCGGWRRAFGRGAGISKLVILVPVDQAAVVSKPSEIMENLPAVLALVDLVPPVGLDVRTQVVPASVALPTDMAREGLLSGVDAHVPAQVRGADEPMAADITEERPFWFPLLFPGLRVVLDNVLPIHRQL